MNRKIQIGFAVLLFMVLLSGCTNSGAGDEPKSENTDEGGGVLEILSPTYKYEWGTGGLILRTRDYGSVKDVELSGGIDGNEYGFWTMQNTENEIYYQACMFKVDGGKITRYSPDGSTTILCEIDGLPRLISCENGCLYYNVRNSETNTESFYRINDCVSGDSTLECLYESDEVRDLNNALLNGLTSVFDVYADMDILVRKTFLKQEEWIYFLHAEGMYESASLYRVSENTGEAEVVQSVLEYMSKRGGSIRGIQVSDSHILLKVNQMQETVYLVYNPESDMVETVCKSTKDFESPCIAKDGFYHLHEREGGDIFLARTPLDRKSCQLLSEEPIDISQISAGTWYVGENYACYSYWCADNERWYPGYMMQVFDLNHPENSEVIESLGGRPIAREVDGTLYLYVNGKVIYTNEKHAGRWYDSGVENHYYVYDDYNMIVDPVFFAQDGKKVSLVMYNYAPDILELSAEERDLGKRYLSQKVEANFRTEIKNADLLLHPGPTILGPIYWNEGVGMPDADDAAYTVEDWLGNSVSGKKGFHVYPTREMHSCVHYDMDKSYDYVSGTISVRNGIDEYTAKVQVYADGEMVWESDLLSAQTTGTFDFKAEIDDAMEVEIWAVSENGHFSELSVDTLYFWIGNIYFHNLDGEPSMKRYYRTKEDADRDERKRQKEEERQRQEEEERRKEEAQRYQEEEQRRKEEEERLREEEKENGIQLTEGRWYYGGYRLSDSCYYTFSEDGSYYTEYATYEYDSYMGNGTYQFDGTTLELYDENGELDDMLTYDKENNVFVSSICEKMTAQDYVDEDGVYHEPTFESMILERDYGN